MRLTFNARPRRWRPSTAGEMLANELQHLKVQATYPEAQVSERIAEIEAELAPPDSKAGSEKSEPEKRTGAGGENSPPAKRTRRGAP
jgi:hypothetical protein